MTNKTSKTYVPRPDSIADRMLKGINKLNNSYSAKNLFDAINHNSTKKHISDAQGSQALFTLAKAGLIQRKRLPGKKTNYIYAPKKMQEPTETKEPTQNSSNEVSVRKFVNNTLHKNHELRDLIHNYILDTPLTYLVTEAKLTASDIQDLLK